MPSPFPTEPGVVLLDEPPESSRTDLAEQLLSGRYARPFVLDNGHLRLLLFSLDYIQSAMRIDDPLALDLAYTRKMMCFLLFHTNVRHLGLIGLGGGSLAKFCHRHLPRARIVAVESDPRVLAFRDAFALPADDERFSVVAADGADWLAASTERFEVLLIDAFGRDGFAPSLSHVHFYADAHERLADDGILVLNLTGETASRQQQIAMVAEVFADNLLVLPVEDGYNHIVFAFRDPGFEPRWKWIAGQSRALGRRYGLDFQRYAASLERCRRMGRGTIEARRGF